MLLFLVLHNNRTWYSLVLHAVFVTGALGVCNWGMYPHRSHSKNTVVPCVRPAIGIIYLHRRFLIAKYKTTFLRSCSLDIVL